MRGHPALLRVAMIEHISRPPGGGAVGVWGRHLLRSAFQPIFAFVGGKLEIAAYEGLIRPFLHGEPVSPGAFFGSIAAADRLRVETLTRTLHVFNAARYIRPPASLFLNFDPSVFTDRQIASNALRDLRLVLHETGVDPARVVCEVTEQKSGSEETLFDFVAMLKTNGFRIAVDDYGADESDFGRIKALNPDIVKFDAHWIVSLMESDPGIALLAAMVEKFKTMKVVTLFEGLEERWQLDVAHRCGVDMVQGFILAMPELVAAEGVATTVAAPADAESLLGAARPGAVDEKAARSWPGPRPFGRRSATP